MITIQSALNSVLGKKIGTLGSVFILTLVSILAVLILIFIFPKTANLRNSPGISEWYLYIGGVLGVAILATPIFLIPRIGATSTLTALVVGQLLLALIIDHFGLFSVPQIKVNLTRILGLCALVFGVFLIKQ
ncbi:MAG: DMT family transporter [Desulfobacterales bacterium]|nr:DMT family transporter [Desulfobacterales bacterium]